MVNLRGILDGGSASVIVISAIVIGFYFFYKSRKLNAKLLTYAGLMIMSIGALYLGAASDFIVKFLTEKNIKPEQLRGLLSYMWVPLTVILAMYIGIQILNMGKKAIILIITYLTAAVIFEVFMFLDAENAFKVTLP